MTSGAVTDVRTTTHSKALKFPVVARRLKAIAQDAEAEERAYLDFLAARLELEARLSFVKTMVAHDLTAVPSLNKANVLALTH